MKIERIAELDTAFVWDGTIECLQEVFDFVKQTNIIGLQYNPMMLSISFLVFETDYISESERDYILKTKDRQEASVRYVGPDTLHNMEAAAGDWIIKNESNEIFIIKKNRFDKIFKILE